MKDFAVCEDCGCGPCHKPMDCYGPDEEIELVTKRHRLKGVAALLAAALVGCAPIFQALESYPRANPGATTRPQP